MPNPFVLKETCEEDCQICGQYIEAHFQVVDATWDESALPKNARVCLCCFAQVLGRDPERREFTALSAYL